MFLFSGLVIGVLVYYYAFVYNWTIGSLVDLAVVTRVIFLYYFDAQHLWLRWSKKALYTHKTLVRKKPVGSSPAISSVTSSNASTISNTNTPTNGLRPTPLTLTPAILPTIPSVGNIADEHDIPDIPVTPVPRSVELSTIKINEKDNKRELEIKIDHVV